MHITFVLPKVSRYPVGGYKMVFEYANRFADKGYVVDILYLNDTFMLKYSIPQFVRDIVASYYVISEPKWFVLNKKIGKKSNTNKRDLGTLIDTDIVIATAVQTVEYVQHHFSCKKVYYIQGLENWDDCESHLFDTYSMDMEKVVIAEWLKIIVDKYSPNPCTVIKNPIDTNYYRELVSRKERKEHSIALLYNELPVKGFRYAFDAIHKLKEIYPDLEVNMFGGNEYPEKLPEWIRYTQNASQLETVEIYNKSRVFLCASIEEGYGLTGLEAMACGCVLVSTKYQGVLEYANNDNALLAPIKDVNGLVKCVVRAFKDNRLCERIVANAKNTVNSLSWIKAVEEYEKVLLRNN